MPDLHNVMLADMFQSSATAVGGRCLSNAIILSLSNIVSILGHRGGWPLPKGVQIVLEYTCMFQSSATAVGGRCMDQKPVVIMEDVSILGHRGGWPLHRSA